MQKFRVGMEGFIELGDKFGKGWAVNWEYIVPVPDHHLGQVLTPQGGLWVLGCLRGGGEVGSICELVP